MPRPVLYVAGPFTAPTHEERMSNVTRAIALGLAVYEAGGVPFVPHLNVLFAPVAEAAGTPLEWGDYMQMDIPILRRCDGLVRLPGPSKGASVEQTIAEELGIPVFAIGSQAEHDALVVTDDLRNFIDVCEELMGHGRETATRA